MNLLNVFFYYHFNLVRGEMKTKALSLIWSFIKKSQKDASYNFKSSKIMKMGLLKNYQMARMYELVLLLRSFPYKAWYNSQ